MGESFYISLMTDAVFTNLHSSFFSMGIKTFLKTWCYWEMLKSHN